MRRQLGFTLVVLLAVIAVIAILVALLLPAVQAARDAARKLECANNFKQVALATLNHASTTDSLPSMEFARLRTNYPIGWRMAILPYLEEGDLYDRLSDPRKWDMLIGFLRPAGRPPMRPAVVESFLCPSTPGTPNYITTAVAKAKPSNDVLYDGFSTRQTSAVGWVFDMLPTPRSRIEHGAWIGTKKQEASMELTLAANRKPARLRWIVAGLSNTILIAEKAGLPVQIEGTEHTAGAWSQTLNHSSYSWIVGVQGMGQTENLYIRDERIVPPLKGTMNFSNTRHLYSYHPSGAHASMCDGSVHFLTEDTSVEILFALATRDNVEFEE